MLSQQIKNELPADLLLNIMQYACYKIHPTAKMIKEASPFCTVWTVGGREEGKEAERQAVEYIEVDSAEMFKEVDIHDEYIRRVTTLTDWFELITEQYADCSDEFRDNLIIYSEMIREVESSGNRSTFKQRRVQAAERAWGLYKIISDCPTSVY